ncbi:zinc finger domain-containing protein [Euroglyphus maynei]|uniref:Zinc finger domain-containing protein n=1 Tax=Euroglyphus maynei TaxID=6958 RepID=A0A1Y3BKN0_EURMA|nr:zinc finger domain-containing protein [Euroglyphus maynei]
MLNNHDLSFDELDSFVAKTANAIDNCHLTSSAMDSATVQSFGSMLRRGSYSFNESEPINIPRMANNDLTHRSTSASGFNISPPNHQVNAALPIGSAFLATRQQSLPNNQSLFDQFAVTSNLNNVNGTTAANQQQQQQSQSNVVAMSAAIMEMQRLKEENNAVKNRIAESQETTQQVLQCVIDLLIIFQWCQLQLNEAQKREKMAEKQRDEALSRLNIREKELEMMRTNESNAFQKRIQDLSTMSRNQLLQLKQKLSQDLSCIDEALKTTATGNS